MRHSSHDTTQTRVSTGSRMYAAFVVLGLCAFSGSIAAEESTPPVPNPVPRPASIAALHADLKFSVMSAPRADATTEESKAGVLVRQAGRIARTLEVSARGLHPDAMRRIGSFDVYVSEGTAIETRSSSTGKIALNAGLAELQPSDDWLAFVLAREMGHVLAGHHESNSTASIITSVIMNLLIPGSSLIKSALSMVGSEAAASSNGETQIREADEIAVRLLQTAGYGMRDVALNLSLGPSGEKLGDGSWAQSFRKSAQNLIDTARPAAIASESPRPPTGVATEIEIAAAVPPPAVSVRLSEEPLVRTRPSGVAGPLLLGGFAVPVRRIE